jgi:AcrR family transcriptional regulator
MTQARSLDRRKQILDAALLCFAQHGYEATSIGQLCEASGASVGSIYHHFGNKPRVAAALYLEGIRQVHQSTLAALLGTRTVERGVASLIESYLGWVEKQPRYAKFLLSYRHADFMQEVQAELRQANLSFRSMIVDWAKPHMERGALPRIEPELYSAILIAPAEVFARSWLDKRARTDMASAQRLLTKAGVAAIKALSE